MVVADIAMVAGETSRSQAYLQALVQHRLFPEFVLVMVNAECEKMPGQKANDSDKELIELFGIRFDPAESVQATLLRSGIPFREVESVNINSDAVYNEITATAESVIIYSGYGGGILRKRILASGKRFLHVHGGYLPDYKGSTTNYYSLLREGTCGASSLWLEPKIDSGPVLLRSKVAAPEDRTRIDYDFDSLLRARVLLDTLQRHVDSFLKWDFGDGVCTGGETYYIVHPLLRHIAILGNAKDDRQLAKSGKSLYRG